MIVKNTTIQNKTKSSRLKAQHVIPFHHVDSQDVVKYLEKLSSLVAPKEQILFSVAVNLTKNIKNKHLESLKSQYEIDLLHIPELPTDSFDLLGSTYQFLNSKKENLELGAFYTGPLIAEDFVKDLDFSRKQTIIDPACGSGMFLFKSDAGPENLVGVDFDPLAVMIAKFNYFIKFPDAPEPKIYHSDFFEWKSENKLKFDYVVGNPPYGANLDLSKIHSKFITSGESFSHFIEQGYDLLNDSGRMLFLVPEALLNVKRHEDVRDFLLSKGNLNSIKKYAKKFSGVMSDLYRIELSKKNSPHVFFDQEGGEYVPKEAFKNVANRKLINYSFADLDILKKIKATCPLTLKDSVFGLGVVTGDNKSKLLQTPIENSEPIFTGKEVEQYRLLPPRWHIIFDRDNLQQVAPDFIYRAPRKLIYKTISKRLIFAYDDSCSLTTNSANILIPKLNFSEIAVCALLNSPLYTYLHLKLSGGVNKVGRENLELLPIPDMSKSQENEIVKLFLNSKDLKSTSALNSFIHENIFELSKDQVRHILWNVERL